MAYSSLLDLQKVRLLLEDSPQNLHTEVCRRLDELGISDPGDIEHIQPETDFSNLLSPIQARKMAKKIKSMFAQQGDDVDLSRLSGNSSPTPSLSSLSSSTSPGSYCLSPSQICESGERPKTALRLEMIRILCAEIARFNRLPGKRNVEIIAAKIVSKYPKSFTDIIGTEVLGSGYSGLVTQILDRLVNAYGRGQNKKRPQCEGESQQDTPMRKESVVTDSYGCINYSPSVLPKNETEASLTTLQNFLKLESFKPTSERDETKEKQYMLKTYIIQRRLINQDPSPSIGHIQNEWPLLFHSEFLMQHFQELTGIDLKSILHASLLDKAKKLLDFVTVKRNKAKGVNYWLERIMSSGGITDVTACLIIPVLAACFGEESDHLMKIYEDTSNTHDVERQSTLLTPHVAVIGDLFDVTTQYFLVLEKKVVIEDLATLEEAICTVFAAYYVFNLQYDSCLSSTLEFIQRCFVNLNPSRGSKSKAKRTGVANNKVVGFLRGYEQFEWHIDM